MKIIRAIIGLCASALILYYTWNPFLYLLFAGNDSFTDALCAWGLLGCMTLGIGFALPMIITMGYVLLVIFPARLLIGGMDSIW